MRAKSARVAAADSRQRIDIAKTIFADEIVVDDGNANVNGLIRIVKRRQRAAVIPYRVHIVVDGL